MERVEISLSDAIEPQVTALKGKNNLWIFITYNRHDFAHYSKSDLIFIISELDIYRLEIDCFLVHFNDSCQVYFNCRTNIRELYLRDQVQNNALIMALIFLSTEDFDSITMTRTKPIEVFCFSHYENSKRSSLLTKDNALLIDLAVKVLERNTTLRIFELPTSIKNDTRILEAFQYNYSLLEPADGVDHKIYKRNQKLLDVTRKVVIFFLIKRQSYKRLSKDIILFIAKIIWRFRHDKEHLRNLAYELEK